MKQRLPITSTPFFDFWGLARCAVRRAQGTYLEKRKLRSQSRDE